MFEIRGAVSFFDSLTLANKLCYNISFLSPPQVTVTMSIYGRTTNDSEYLNENSLPVELQTPNVISPVYNVSAIPSSNGIVKTGPNVGYNGNYF